VAAHLRACPECVDELISIAVVTGALRFADRTQRAPDFPSHPAVPDDTTQPSDIHPIGDEPDEAARQIATILRRDRTHRWRQRAMAAAAAVILLAGGTLLGNDLNHTAKPPTAPIAVQAPLRPIQAPPSAGGRIQVTVTGDTRQLDVQTSGLPAAPPDHYYEVWVFNPATLKMLPMGILGPSGQGQYQIAAPIMAGYNAVDISLQTNNGNPNHSNTSVLRAYL
jgi:hypothetical protein